MQKIKISELKENGYYIRKSIDERKKQTMYQIAKDIDDKNREILMELNKPAYLFCKTELKLEVKTYKSTFLNFDSYAHTNKSNVPMYEIEN